MKYADERTPREPRDAAPYSDREPVDRGLHWRVQLRLDVGADIDIRRLSRYRYATSELLRSYRVWYAEGPGGYELVPAGMSTDGASIPRFFLRIFSRDRGRHWVPALMHDLYYGSQPQGMTRREADRRFREAMRIYGVPAWSRWSMWLGLRLGGWTAWRANARKLAAATPSPPAP